jgi:uncharacterized protein
MYKRLNITLSDDVLGRADAFAKRERYSRSALIAAALDSFVSGGAASAEVAQEPSAVYAPDAVGLNPAVAPLVPAIVDTCRRHGVLWAALVGSSTQPDPAIVPRDLDILVRFEPDQQDRAHQYFGLMDDLARVVGKPVDIIENDAVRNPYLREEFDRTKVVLYEAP